MNTFNHLSDVASRLGYSNGIVSKTEFKFVKPNVTVNWEQKLMQCKEAIEILNSIYKFMPVEKDNYNFKLDWRFLYKETTVIIEYDRSDYTFLITHGRNVTQKRDYTGEYFRVSQRNQVLDLASICKGYLSKLTVEMKNTLPKSHSERIMANVGLRH